MENRHRRIYDMGKPYLQVIRENVLDLFVKIIFWKEYRKFGLFTLRDVSIIPWMLNLVAGLSSLRSCYKELLPARPQ